MWQVSRTDNRVSQGFKNSYIVKNTACKQTDLIFHVRKCPCRWCIPRHSIELIFSPSKSPLGSRMMSMYGNYWLIQITTQPFSRAYEITCNEMSKCSRMITQFFPTYLIFRLYLSCSFLSLLHQSLLFSILCIFFWIFYFSRRNTHKWSFLSKIWVVWLMLCCFEQVFLGFIALESLFWNKMISFKLSSWFQNLPQK